MPILVNLVATRSKDGDHAAFLRWYNDHVQLLLGFAALQRATLYRRAGAAQAGGPEYLCLYEFPGRAEFDAFEVSEARAQAQHVVQTGWARSGIEIVQRTQYFRLGRRWADAAHGAGAAVQHVQSLALGAGPLPGVARWLADRLHGTLGARFTELAWHRQCAASDAGGDALILAQSRDVDAARGTPLEHGRWLDDAATEVVGHGPASVAVHWQGCYERVCSWAH